MGMTQTYIFLFDLRVCFVLKKTKDLFVFNSSRLKNFGVWWDTMS